MIAKDAIIRLRHGLRRHQKAIIHSHNCGHTIYWTTAALSAPSFAYGCLASVLAVLTISLAILEE